MRRLLFLALLPTLIFSAEGKFGSETSLGYSISNPIPINYFSTYHKTSWTDTVTSVRFMTNYMAEIKNAAIASSSGFVEFGYDRILNDKWTVFVYSDVMYRLINTMDTMSIIGSGLKYTSIRNSRIIFDTSVAPIFQRKLQVDTTDTSSFSISIRNRITWLIADGHSFALPHFFTFATNDSQNQFHIFNPQYTYTISSNIFLNIGHRYIYSMLSSGHNGFTSAQVVFTF